MALAVRQAHGLQDRRAYAALSTEATRRSRVVAARGPPAAYASAPNPYGIRQRVLREATQALSYRNAALLGAATAVAQPAGGPAGARAPQRRRAVRRARARLRDLRRWPSSRWWPPTSAARRSIRASRRSTVDCATTPRPPCRKRTRAWLSSGRGSPACAPAKLSARRRIDRSVALAEIGFLLHEHQVRRHQLRSLDSYVDEPFRGVDWQIQGMTATGALDLRHRGRSGRR